MDFDVAIAAPAVAAALMAGAVNAIAGGGTFVTFGVLVALGVPALEANATSTAALWLGFVGSTWGYRRHLGPARALLPALGPVSVAGAALGAWLLVRLGDDAFQRAVPWLLATATVLFAVAPRLQGLRDPADRAPRVAPLIGAQVVIAVYGGYFGGGIGILMLTAFALCGIGDLLAANGLKGLLAFAINAAAVAVFGAIGPVRWPLALTMAIAAALGGWLGAHVATRSTAVAVRWFVVATGALLTVAFFCKGR
ncbi:MAG: sulfite exporter TauE/SafE family protein [Deltaproteobacteria bacterium]|nr:sulfite exporter TauE/SafE family protein [Deltaproteobacteria bacterium]